MAYQIIQINDQIESGILFTTFLLVDDNQIMPDVRIEKNFKVSDNLELRIENQKTIDALFYENEWLNNQ